MKKNSNIFFLWVFLSVVFTVNAQLINCNPDPDGEPWWAGGLVISPESDELLESFPNMMLSEKSANTLLPSMVDNSKKKYFRPIFMQSGASCSQAAEIGYIFTYMINRERNLASNVNENVYPTHFTWNFLNGGENAGAYPTQGWQLVKWRGVPNNEVYGGEDIDKLWLFPDEDWPYPMRRTVWMTGYDKYRETLKNRVITKIENIFVDTDSGLLKLKHWLYDLNEGDTISGGGLALFSVMIPGAQYDSIFIDNSNNEKKAIVTSWGSQEGHALTIVGYNDSIKYDYNGDGLYTNNIDINGDGKVDMKDWEIGALKVANSWGKSYPFPKSKISDGFVYMPYCLLAKKHTEGGIVNSYVTCIKVKEEYTPTVTVRAKMEHVCRNKINLFTGTSSLQSSLKPNLFQVRGYDNGGCLPMLGINNIPIEIELDVSDIYSYGKRKVFFIVSETDTANIHEGIIHNASLVDYRWGEEFELPFLEHNVSIVNNDTTFLSIEYDLIKHEEPIIRNITFNSNKVSRFKPVLSNNSTMTLKENKKIDMYNSTITIDEGSLLKLDGKNKITAKRGNCKIVINGDIELGDSVVFEAAGDASLEILFNNRNSEIILNNITFTNCRIKFTEVNRLFVNGCNFDHCRKLYLDGNISITNSTFIETSPYAYTVTKNRDFVFSNNTITNSNIQGVTINGYRNYIVDGNHVNAGTNNLGISIFNSGGGTNLRSKISNNSVNNSHVGIEVYNTLGRIFDNKVFNNNIGVRLFNISNMSFTGSQTPLPEGQVIRDNSSYELYISGNAFPSPFKFNKIIDNDNMGNPSDPLLYYEPWNNISQIDISDNYWGVNFNATEDLKPYFLFDYLPVWQPNPLVVNSDNTIESIYLSAQESADNGDYATANTLYRSLISQYPEDEYAKSSMKELLNLEEYINNDYSSLQSYYLALNDSSLLKLADNLANKCNERLGNWEQAIDWYEAMIANPPTLEDSVFAVIDLEHLLLQMEMSPKGGKNVGKIRSNTKSDTEEVDFETFIENRDRLLSLLPGENTPKGNRADNQYKSLCLTFKVSPNPSKDFVNINYEISERADVSLFITDNFGNTVKTVTQGIKTEGLHHLTVNNSDLRKGVYFCVLILNGEKARTEKIIIQ